ncbi:MAG TPA: non-ribosomal peptide synthase/polyketide synthase [Thermoanaerobaculia bacterium]|jgi:amino acid adenylation domain-containing protein
MSFPEAQFPLTLAQQDIYFDQLHAAESPRYNIGGYIRFGAVDVARLERAHGRMVASHDAFGLRINASGATPMQYVGAARTLTLAHVDLSGTPDAAAAADEWLRERFTTLLPLDRCELFQASLLKLSDDEYRYVVVAHHLMIDGWGFSNLARVLGELYQADGSTEAMRGDDLSSWQTRASDDAEYVSSSRYNESGRYWTEHCNPLPEPPLTPFHRARFDGKKLVTSGRKAFFLSRDEYNRLLVAADEMGVGISAWFTALLAGYFHKLTGQNRLILGIPTHNRKTFQQKRQIGVYIGVNALAIDLQGDDSFADVARRIQQAQKKNYRHSRYPIGHAIRELGLLDQSRRLYDVGFNYLRLDSKFRIGDEVVEIKYLSHEHEATPLSVTLFENGDEQPVEIQFDYNHAYFDKDEATLLAHRFGFIVGDALRRGDFAIGTLATVAPVDEKIISVGTSTPFPQQRIHELFEAQAAATPDAIALVFDPTYGIPREAQHGQRTTENGQRLTYRELNERANAIAHALIARGVTAGELVAICVERSIENIAGTLGILKAGAAYLPLDPSYPEQRLRQMLDDSGVRIVLRAEDLAVDGFVVTNPEIAGTPDDLAYVMYTSGSTGLPKGVMVEHRGVVRLVAENHYVPLSAETRMLQVSTTAFDAATFEIWGSLLNGGQLVLYPEPLIDLPVLNDTLERHAINTVWLTAGLFEQWSYQLPKASALRYVLAGGDVLSPAAVARVYRALPDVTVINGYGPTENTTFTTTYAIPRTSDLSRPIPLGTSINGTSLYILDANGAPVPVGTPGELYVGGAGLARGYWNQPELTAEKFVVMPDRQECLSHTSGGDTKIAAAGSMWDRHSCLSEGDGGSEITHRLYRTGDLVRFLPDGTLSFLGRIDNQVKIRGFRIEPGEIEAQLGRMAEVREAVVVVKGEGSGKYLAAYVVTGLSETELRQALEQTLPAHMIPAAFVRMAALPLNANGKVDRHALPEPELQEQHDYLAPETETESRVAAIWQDVLKLDRVSITANFFELGGHSLLATRVASAIAEAFGKTVPVRALFEHNTVRTLSAHLDAQSGTSYRGIPLASRQEPLPASFAQQRLWFIDQLEQGSTQYNMPAALRLTGSLNRAALQSTLDTIVARHEVLRTRFIAGSDANGSAIQDIRPAEAVPMAFVDLTKAADDLEWLMQEEAERPFDLAHDLMLRATIVRLGEDDHVLLLTLHHIAADGWSAGVLVKELTALYEAHCLGIDPELAPLPIQYADYAVWQRNNTALLEPQLAYWKKQLAHAPSVHGLPLDRTRPARQQFAGRNLQAHLDRATLDGLQRLANDHGATLFMVLQTAFSLLVSRWSGVADVVVGTPVAGRNHTETESLIGFFVNTLVLRNELSEELPFTRLLQQGRQQVLDAFSNQDVPFEMLVEELRPERSLSHAPLYQLVFALHNNEPFVLELPELTIAQLHGEPDTAKFDLTVSATENERGLDLTWNYATSIFEAQTIERLAASFAVLLDGIVAAPETQAGRLPILPPADAASLTSEITCAKQFATIDTLHQRFERQAAATPNGVAVVFNDESLTYGELNEKANQLAHALIKRGVKADTLVGICVERSVEMLTGILGILKAGGAYLPLDPDYPAARLQYTIEDAAVDIVLTQAKLAGRVPVANDKLLVFDGDQFANEPRTNPNVDVLPSHLAYVIYTSGSTGNPKGVMIEHRNVTRLMDAADVELTFGADDAWTLFHSYAFDFSVWEIWGALLYGGRLVVVPFETSRSPEQFYALLQRERVTVLNQTPSAFYALTDVALGRERLDALRYVVFGGEALVPSRLRNWVAEYGDDQPRLINMYGITETTVHVTYRRMLAIDCESEVSDIGRPLADLVTYVGSDGALLPIGVPGELYVGGAGLARGYLNKPELTASRFIDNPFGGEGRLYRTGDLVRYRLDLQLEYLGRIDDQVKIRGFRIELGEIKAQLLQHAGVKEALVIARGDGAEKRLIAYLVPSEPVADAIDAEELIDGARRTIKQHLPDYMVPAAFVVLDAFPLTSNGKIDKKALPEPQRQAQSYAAPATATEERLAAIWQQILKLDAVSVTANFFELGGHSLLATRIASAVSEAFGTTMPVRALFEHNTVRTLSAWLDQQSGTGYDVIPVVDRSEPLPLSFAQQRLWFIDQLEQGSAQYNMAAALRLEGTLDVNALQAAFDTIVERHEVLRTRFIPRGESSVQDVRAAEPLPLQRYDLAHLPEALRESALRQLAQEEANRLFDLRKDLMLRVTLVRLGDEAHALLITLHHIAGDGWSVDVLVQELNTLYSAYARGEANPLQPLRVQYADYAAWEHERSRSEAFTGQVDYWKQQLAGIPPVHGLPLDKPRPAQQVFTGGTVQSRLDGAAYAELLTLAKRENVTPFMLLQTAFALLLARWSNVSDLVIGSPIAGRNHKDLEPLIGFFVNTLVLRTKLTDAMTFDDLLLQNRQTILDAFAHQDVAFDALVGELKPERSLSYAPLFQIIFTLQKENPLRLALPGVTAHALEQGTEATKFDLHLNAVEEGDGLTLTWSYADSLFEAGTIERMAGSFAVLLDGIARNPRTSIHRLPLLTGADRRQLALWNETNGDYPTDKHVHELIEAQVLRTPDAIALESGDRRLTYRELNERANQVAHALVQRGVRPDSLVGIYVEPSAETVIAMLAILKAGGAYVPLSATLPDARIQHMLTDGGVQIILTRSGLRDRLGFTGVELLALDGFSDRTDGTYGYPVENLDPVALGLEPSHLAYVLYTSGTTGQPKGVMISHGSAVNFGTALLDRLALPTVERWLLLTATTFDIAFFEWFGCLQMGGTVVVADEACQFDAAELRRFLEANRFQLVQATPSRWTQLIDAGWQGQKDVVALAGGEPLTFELQQKMATRVGALWNGYGPTEATVYTCNHKVDNNEPLPHRLSIGTGLRNYQHYILSAHNEPVAIGAIGELHIAGPSLGRGYLNRPELTAEKFITVPGQTIGPIRQMGPMGQMSSASPALAPEIGNRESEIATRLYKTGDLVRFLPNGDIAYIGRTDDQVKVRGFRIELGEIEAQLRRVDGVREGVVLARGESTDKYLAAYVVAEGELADADEQEWRDLLRNALKQTLPEYMVPAAFVRLPAFPLNSNGKVDKKALPEPERQQEHDYDAPATETETRLAAIWQQILKLDRVSVTANFFELGGHSLLATRIASAVSEAFGTKMPVRALFEHNTVRTLSAWLDQQTVTGHHDIPAADRNEPLPLSFAQQRLWFIDQLEQGSAQYNMAAALRLDGTLDRAALQQTFDAIVERHEVLRTRFVESGETRLQEIRPTEPIVIGHVDLSQVAAAEREAALRRVASEEAARPFDLRNDLMLRVALVRLAGQEHVLLLTAHHIAADGWSVGVLLEEVGALYRAFTSNEANPLAPLPIQYADYAQWQRTQLQGDVYERHLAYWKTQLADLPPVHSLPLDKPRPAQQRFEGAAVVRGIDAPLLAELDALAQSHHASLFMLLQSAFALFLGRWSHSNDIVLGSPIAGREHRALDPLIGFFVNTLVLRTRLTGTASFRELLEQTKQTSLDAYAHQSIPFEKLVDELGSARSLSHGALFQIALSQAPDLAMPNLPELEVELLAPELATAKFDLNLIASPRNGAMELHWEYATALFEAESIERMAASFETLLRGIVAAPESAIDALPLTDGVVVAEEAQAAFPDAAIHELFEAQVLRAPGAVALVRDGETLTYAEVNERANQLAHLLLAKGVNRGELVGLRAERTFDNIIATLAVLKAGAAYLPLDPGYPAERSRFMLEDGGVRILLTQATLLDSTPGNVEAIVLETPGLTAGQPRTNPSLNAGTGDLAYVMYTSGSTGKPKGVMVEHRGVVRLVINNHYVPLDGRTRILQIASCAFDAATFEIWGSLLNGGRLVLYPDTLIDLTVLNRELDGHGITTIFLTTGLFEQWSHLLPRSGSLQHVLTGGEVMSPAAVARVYAAMPDVTISNVYGPTENTTFTTFYPIARDTDFTQAVPLGHAINGTTVHVLDAAGNPLPHGAIGELCVGGAGLARGYRNRPELTAEKFIEMATGRRPQVATRLYRTGDLARVLPDGNLAFIGRIDDQVKLRGFRIEPGEIETQLLRITGVRETVVLVKGSGSDKYLAAYVATDRPAEELRQALKQTLPDYMVPAAFVILPSLPLNANGKVDRRALPEPERQTRDTYVAASTPTEMRLAAIWQQVLKLDGDVSVTGNFFELGGDSLLATRIVSVVSQAFDRTVPVRALFEHNSVRALARYLEQQSVTVHASIPAADRTGPLPLSFAQQRLWFIDQLEEGSAQYNMPGALRLTGALDRDALQAAFDAIIERHEVLRTRFSTFGDEAIQQIGAAEPLPLQFVDLTQLDAADRETAVQRLAQEEAARPFDLARDLMLRAVLLQLAEEEHVLLFTMHHIASDGWSVDVLIGEFAALYRACVHGEVSPLAPLPIQYADYAAWQRTQLQGEAYERHVDYWRVQLAGVPPVHSLPLDKPRPAQQRFEGGTVERTLDRQLVAQLEELGHGHRATLFMVLQSAFALLLGRWSRGNDIVIGSPIAGREHRDLDPLIGFFVNTLVLRTRLSETQSFHALLEEAKQTALDAYAHQAIPFETLVDELKPERSLGHGALFQIMFSMLKGTAALPQLPGLELAPLGAGSSLIKTDLNLTAIEGEAQLSLQWHYATSLFERESIERMAASFELLLRGIVAAPERPVYALPLVTEVVRSEGATVDRSSEPCVHVAFEAQAALTPDAVAVVAGERTLTYRTLNEQANRLAHALLAKSLPAKARVGFYVERSPEALVSMLGILKAGMTYVPFEPSNTTDRLQHIITNGEIECVAVQQSLAAKLPAGLQLVIVDEELPYATHNPDIAVSHDDSAYVMYTSGSTGVPKGVEITHGGLLDYCAFASQHYYGEHLSGSFVVTSHGFDITVPSLYVPLLRGGAVNLTAPGEELLQLGEMLGNDGTSGTEGRRDAYLLRMTPMHVTGALSLLAANHVSNTPHVFVIGGEAFPATLASELQTRFPNARIYNHYGPTETVVGCAIYDVTASLRGTIAEHSTNNQQPTTENQHRSTDNGQRKTDNAARNAARNARLPIGRAMSNHELYVLNEAQQLAPVGVAGELCIGGAGVAKGYVNQPDVTAAKFIANPFGEGRLYRSGDVVRMLPSGDLEFLGRVDDQIKVRGFRIEPGEIEATLKQTVKDALVVVQGEEEDKALVAYVIGDDDSILPELKARLAKALPEYMIPTGWCVLSAFPLNANGKIDRKALPAVVRQATAEHVEPATATERLLVEIWQTVLKLQTSPSVTANFFELGGHSLLATRVASAVSQSFDKKIPVRALFEHSTIRSLAAHLDALSQSEHHAIVPADRSQELPLSFAQQRLWFVDQLTGRSAQYNMPAAFRLRGRLDTAALQQALDEIVRRHEIVRTTYVADLGTARQVINDVRPIVIAPTDLTSLDPAARELRVQELAMAEARTPFDLSGDLMVRASLLKLGETEHVMLFTMHHIASDGWSIGVLIREFVALYEAFSSGKESPLAPLAIQYADYAKWQRNWLQGDVLEGQLAYWRTQLADLPPVHRLPLDKPRPAVQGFAGARRVQLLDPALLAELNGLARGRNASLYMVLQSALALLVGRWSNETDIVIGNTIAGRTHQDVESLIGFFVNNVVLRTDLSTATTFDELLEQVKRTSLDAHVNQDIPFEMLVDELKVERSLSHSPLVQIVFTFRNNEETNVTLPDLSIENAADTFGTSRFDLELLVTERPEGLELSWAYSTDVFEQPTIERLGASLEVLLRNAVAAPAAPLRTIDVMTEADRARRTEWEQPDVAFPEHLTIHELFEQHAAATPDATAVVFNDEEMTYGELNAAANKLARYLVDKNVKPDSRVGICVERSLDMLVGILGILKAGGAYVPIDPNYPEERIAHVLEDSGLSLVLTQGELLQLTDAFSDYPTMPIDAGFRNVLLARYSDQNLDHAALGLTPRNLAYVIYTSGSTGTPKGVMVEHRGVVRLVINNHYVALNGETRILQASTCAFDAATFEMWGALLNGGQLILYPESLIDLKVLNQQIDEHRVNTLWLTAGLFEQWSYQLPKRGSLRYVLAGGDVISPAAVARVYAAMENVAVINGYGPTENTTFSTCYTVPRTADFGQPIPLGTKINGTSLHVLDRSQRPLPTGAIGELYLGGPGLARGYLNRDELTAEKFITVGAERLYRTGDLVRYLPDGTLAFIGRVDDQVKIRGFRIELGEIEAHLTRLPAIRDAVVMALGEGNNKYLAAYVVPAGEWDEPALRQTLKQSLPDHMLPTAYVVLKSFPLNANGKVDKKALPEPDRQGHDGYVAPSTETEKQIAGIWQEILKLESPVSANAHFFDLGGNSLSLLRVKAHIERAFELEVPTRLFFEYPTVTGIALATELLRTKHDVAVDFEEEEMEVGEL